MPQNETNYLEKKKKLNKDLFTEHFWSINGTFISKKSNDFKKKFQSLLALPLTCKVLEVTILFLTIK